MFINKHDCVIILWVTVWHMWNSYNKLLIYNAFLFIQSFSVYRLYLSPIIKTLLNTTAWIRHYMKRSHLEVFRSTLQEILKIKRRYTYILRKIIDSDATEYFLLIVLIRLISKYAKLVISYRIPMNVMEYGYLMGILLESKKFIYGMPWKIIRLHVSKYISIFMYLTLFWNFVPCRSYAH